MHNLIHESLVYSVDKYEKQIVQSALHGTHCCPVLKYEWKIKHLKEGSSEQKLFCLCTDSIISSLLQQVSFHCF